MNKHIAYRITRKLNLYDTYYYFNRTSKSREKYAYLKKHKNIILLMAPNYGNIGDQAIQVATEKFMKDKFSEYQFISIDFEETYKNLYAILYQCNREDIFLLQGGGNFGDLYPEFEHVRRYCIKHIKNNKIIVMPSTVTYTKTKKGKRELKFSKKVFEANSNVCLLAREKYSYDYLKKNFCKCKVSLVPDMVFYLYDKNVEEEKRISFMLCIRREMESIFSKDQQEQLIKKILDKYPKSFLFDTVVDRKISSTMRKEEVNSMLNQFRRTRLVITDRMHGMIICAITNTPCIVLKSLDNKILGSYTWIKHLKYIQLIDDASANYILDAIEKVQLETNRKFVEVNFEHLENVIRCFLE